MVTKLDRALRREVTIRRRAYVVTMDREGIRLTLKGHRKGQELRWDDWVSGEAALAVALNASLAQANDAPAASPGGAAAAKASRAKSSPAKASRVKKRRAPKR